MTETKTSWSTTLPAIIDEDGDKVTLTLEQGAAFFVKLRDNTLDIDDLSHKDIQPGMYLLKLVLDDGKGELAKVNFAIFVTAVPVAPQVEEPAIETETSDSKDTEEE